MHTHIHNPADKIYLRTYIQANTVSKQNFNIRRNICESMQPCKQNTTLRKE